MADYTRKDLDKYLKQYISQLQGKNEKEQMDFLLNTRNKRAKEIKEKDPNVEVQFHPELDALGMLYQSIGAGHDPKLEFEFEEETDPFTNEGNEIVNDKNIDAIKDNFTPPGAKGEKKMNKRMFAPDMLCPKCKEPMLYQAGGGRIKCSKCGNEVGEDTLDSLELYKSPNIEESEQLKDEIDTNDNGKIEEDEMADFQKSLDDYASKNKKGREDIPARYRK